jgi:hypothetical protein
MAQLSKFAPKILYEVQLLIVISRLNMVDHASLLRADQSCNFPHVIMNLP